MAAPSSLCPNIWRSATNSHLKGVGQKLLPPNSRCSNSSTTPRIALSSVSHLPQTTQQDVKSPQSTRHLSTSPRICYVSPSSSSSASSSSSSRRPPPAPSNLSSGHLPNKPGSAFLSDLDDCFFDQMRVWKDKAGNELTEIPTFRLLDGKGRAVSKEAEARVAEVSGRALDTMVRV